MYKYNYIYVFINCILKYILCCIEIEIDIEAKKVYINRLYVYSKN